MADPERLPIVQNEQQNENYNSTAFVTPPSTVAGAVEPVPPRAHHRRTSSVTLVNSEGGPIVVTDESRPQVMTERPTNLEVEQPVQAQPVQPVAQPVAQPVPLQPQSTQPPGYNLEAGPPPAPVPVHVAEFHQPLDNRPLPTRTRMGDPVQTGMPPPGLVDMNHTMDNLEYSRYHSLLAAAGAMASLAAGCQFFLTAVIQAFVTCKFDLSTSENTWLLCSLFILYPFGSIVGGWWADKVGRKWPLIISLWVFAIVGLLQTFASAWWVFLCCRLILGWFLPAVTNLPLIMWLEVSSRCKRDEGILGLLCMFALGATYVCALAYIMTQIEESYAFEIVMIVTSLPAFIAVFFAHFIVESPRFLGVSKSLVETEQALIDYGYVGTPNVNVGETPFDIYFVGDRGNICLVLKHYCCAISLLSTIFFCSFYLEIGTIVLIPYLFYWDYCGMGDTSDDDSISSDILTAIKLAMAELLKSLSGSQCAEIEPLSFLYLLVITVTLTVGYVTGYFTQQYFGSRVSLIVYSVLATIFYALLSTCFSDAATILELCFAMVFIGAVQYSLYGSALIQCPTFLRASGVGYIDAWGKIGAICAIVMVCQLGTDTTIDICFWSFLAIGICLIFFICLVSIECKDALIYDNLPANPRANEPPPICLPPRPPPPPPPPPHYHPPPPPPPGYHRPYYY